MSLVANFGLQEKNTVSPHYKTTGLQIGKRDFRKWNE